MDALPGADHRWAYRRKYQYAVCLHSGYDRTQRTNQMVWLYRRRYGNRKNRRPCFGRTAGEHRYRLAFLYYGRAAVSFRTGGILSTAGILASPKPNETTDPE